MCVKWLFSQDRRSGRIALSTSGGDIRPPFDGFSRQWMKSDPATSSIIDRMSANYIVNSEEGVKYFHFFKYTLMGAEEHYFISLLGNWERTKSVVRTIKSIPVFNTWILGKVRPKDTVDRNKHEKTVHTSYLVGNLEFDILKGLSEAGVVLARKFSSDAPQILDLIDKAILDVALNDSYRSVLP